ncbi:M55 family metallopeptidase [Pyrococcus sp. ST04]|uniref:M55 family metallopeptidase n=1 Tax=Pyrococcus sp. ST04 TaxID=1183377 RepID=UPI0002605D0C|nr:M55 family metallopeptidase [Pyrococcus sp. ST04]AFK23041.1 putative dipeptide transport protein dppA [Pyrococcus sp. ST04]
MRAFVSIDLEGLPYIVSREHLFVKGALYNEARKIATRIAKVVAEELHSNGFEEVIIADSHGPMVNVIPEEMPEFVSIVRGFPRPLSMVAFAKGSDIAVFLGYHAKAGTGYATFDHTYSGATIDKIEINGIEVSEFLMNAMLLGEWNIPVGLVAGDEALREDTKYTPWTEFIALKKASGRYSALSPAIKVIEENLREGVKRAVDKLKKNELKPLKVEKPVKVNVRFLNSAYAEVAELLPIVERTGGKEVQFSADSVEDAYKILEVLIFAAAGVSYITSR